MVISYIATKTTVKSDCIVYFSLIQMYAHQGYISVGNSLKQSSDSPDEKFPAQVLQENSGPEIAKQAGCAGKQLGAMYRLKILVQGQEGIIIDILYMMW